MQSLACLSSSGIDGSNDGARPLAN